MTGWDRGNTAIRRSLWSPSRLPRLGSTCKPFSVTPTCTGSCTGRRKTFVIRAEGLLRNAKQTHSRSISIFPHSLTCATHPKSSYRNRVFDSVGRFALRIGQLGLERQGPWLLLLLLFTNF